MCALKTLTNFGRGQLFYFFLLGCILVVCQAARRFRLVYFGCSHAESIIPSLLLIRKKNRMMFSVHKRLKQM